MQVFKKDCASLFSYWRLKKIDLGRSVNYTLTTLGVLRQFPDLCCKINLSDFWLIFSPALWAYPVNRFYQLPIVELVSSFQLGLFSFNQCITSSLQQFVQSDALELMDSQAAGAFDDDPDFSKPESAPQHTIDEIMYTDVYTPCCRSGNSIFWTFTLWLVTTVPSWTFLCRKTESHQKILFVCLLMHCFKTERRRWRQTNTHLYAAFLTRHIWLFLCHSVFPITHRLRIYTHIAKMYAQVFDTCVPVQNFRHQALFWSMFFTMYRHNS